MDCGSITGAWAVTRSCRSLTAGARRMAILTRRPFSVRGVTRELAGLRVTAAVLADLTPVVRHPRAEHPQAVTRTRRVQLPDRQLHQAPWVARWAAVTG